MHDASTDTVQASDWIAAHPFVGIIDFGSQYTQLIARRLREMGVYTRVFPAGVTAAHLRTLPLRGLILSGGPETASHARAPSADPQIYQLGCPVLGICYGMQLMALHFGGRVQSAKGREFGRTTVTLCTPMSSHDGSVHKRRLFSSLYLDKPVTEGQNNDPMTLTAWMSHGDSVCVLPAGFVCTARTQTVPIVAMEDTTRGYYGVQFHPEVTHTPEGGALLSHFAVQICGCVPDWTAENKIDALIASVRHQVGDECVVLGLSGGVDSSVTAALLSRAVGDQLTCLFVDNGLLRENESHQVQAAMSGLSGLNLQVIDAKARFLSALKGQTDPEEKRKIIGRVFVAVFEEAARHLSQAKAAESGVKWLAQGTIYPDVIESAGQAGQAAHVIKSHHNVGGLPDTLSLKLLEPLSSLFKDEVRQLGMALGLPSELVNRHPFPGPGLAVRIMGEVTPLRLEMVQKADAIFIAVLRRHHYYDKVAQAFAVFLPVKTVGVVGDMRQYADVIALRAVETVDFMTARWAHLPLSILEEASEGILNAVPGVCRVVYDISSKPPATIEWE